MDVAADDEEEEGRKKNRNDVNLFPYLFRFYQHFITFIKVYIIWI